MIEYLRGKIHRIDGDHVVVDVGGVGYGVAVPGSTLEGLPAEGEEVELHVSTVIREDAFDLYAFATLEERAVFQIFLNVSGIGPRTALDVLSTISIAEFASAVATGNIAVLTRVPGIGRKKAERLVVEMKDRLQLLPTELPTTRPGARAGAAGAGAATEPDLYEDAVAALTALGYKPATAARNVTAALRSFDHEEPSVEDLVKAALQANL